MDKEQKREKEVKRRFQSWFKPSILELVDKLYEQDDCRSRSEFIEKAIVFYAGYLSTENARGYLPNVVTSTLKAIVDNSDNRQNRMMFKLAVEIAIVQNRIAATQDIDPTCASYGVCGRRHQAVRVYAEIGISEHGKVGTRSGLHCDEVLSGKINDIT